MKAPAKWHIIKKKEKKEVILVETVTQYTVDVKVPVWGKFKVTETQIILQQGPELCKDSAP